MIYVIYANKNQTVDPIGFLQLWPSSHRSDESILSINIIRSRAVSCMLVSNMSLFSRSSKGKECGLKALNIYMYYIYTYTCMCIITYVHTYVSIYIHTYIHYIPFHSIPFHSIPLHYIHTYIYIYIHTYILCVYINIYIIIYTYIYT